MKKNDENQKISAKTVEYKKGEKRDLPRDPSYPGSHRPPPGSVKVAGQSDVGNEHGSPQGSSGKSAGYASGKVGTTGAPKVYSDFRQIREAVNQNETPLRATCNFDSGDPQAKETLRVLKEGGYKREVSTQSNSDESTWVRKV